MTVTPLAEQIPLPSAPKVTAPLPDPPVAESVNVTSGLAEYVAEGMLDTRFKLCCAALATVMLLEELALMYCESLDFVAETTHEPAVIIVAVEPLTEHTEGDNEV